MKILAIQFRYLGDAVLMTPALRAIKDQRPDCELHVLVAEEAAPLLQHLPWLTRVWAFPRRRGQAGFRRSWPMIRALRRERFDRSVDFGGNDRSALIGFFCGAPVRLGPLLPGGFLGRRFCYTQTMEIPADLHQSLFSVRILTAWGIAEPRSLEMEIRPDPALASEAAKLVPGSPVLCHLATSQPKKEWPLPHWAELSRRAAADGISLAFTTGISSREQALLAELKKLAPQAATLPPIPNLPLFLAMLERAGVFISGDTGPLHFAAALRVPTLSLFGASPAAVWAPFGSQHRTLQAPHCTCGGDTAVCVRTDPCMAQISPDSVFRSLQEMLAVPRPGR